MADQHYCVNGKWREGKTKDCPKHSKGLKKQSRVVGVNAVNEL